MYFVVLDVSFFMLGLIEKNPENYSILLITKTYIFVK